jgi:hypothetical protein
VAQERDGDVAAVLQLLDAGEEPSEAALAPLLRRPSCPGALVERLVTCSWILGSRRILQLVVRHPRCPRHFAWEALPRLGWHDLLEICRDPRTSPAVRKQSERKLIERIATLTLGERTALARLAPRGVVAALLGDDQPSCIEALVSNPQFTETEALRMLNTNGNPACVQTLLRNSRWGRKVEILRAAVRSASVPLGVALGLLALLPEAEIAGLDSSPDVGPQLRAAATRLLSRRKGEGTARVRTSPP